MTTMTTDEIITMLVDTTDELGIDLDVDTALLDWVNKLLTSVGVTQVDDMDSLMSAAYAAQAIADIVAARLNEGREETIDAALVDMYTDAGWQYEAHNIVLWITDRNQGLYGRESLVVWLGNDRDPNMVRLGTADIK